MSQQDAAKHDPVGGAGLGFVNVFSPEGMLQRLEHGPWFNAPWGVFWATQHFGEVTRRHGCCVQPRHREFPGNMLNPDGSTLTIDGLCALRFGNDGPAGPGTSLFFTAGPNGEVEGLLARDFQSPQRRAKTTNNDRSKR